jgi:hypothetical protein
MKRSFQFILFFILFLCAAGPAFAQAMFGIQAYETTNKLWNFHFGEVPAGEPADGYDRTSFENLSKLYWALGMHNEKDDTAVEQYLFINECDLYNKFSGDAGQWNSLKESARLTLCKQKSAFPIRFEFIVPVPIAAYDPAKKEFTVDPASGLANLRTLDVSSNAGADVCGSKQDFKSYPRGLTVNLVQPFTLKAIPASPELVAFYNAQKAAGKVTVYLRLKTRMGQYIETAQGKGGWHAVVTGAIDGYEIYNDPKETKILFAQDLPKIKLEKRAEKKPEAETAPPSAPAATAGGLNDLYTADKAPPENDGSAPDENPCAGDGPAKGELP